MPPGPPTQPQPQSWPQQGMQPPADRGVDPDGPATDAASTPTDGLASVAGWTPPPWTAGPDAPAGWSPPPWTAGRDAFWRIPAGLLIAVALVLVGLFAGWYFDGIEQSGSIAMPATGEGDLSGLPHDYKLRTDLRVGDCYDLKDPYADQIEEVKAVPCTTEHEFEVFYVGAMGKGSYPTDDAFADYVVQYCDPAFGDYVGKAVDDSDLDYDWLVPTDDAWRSGGRTVQCAAYDPDISRLTRSLRGTRQ
jgi:hypothetical protein